MFVHVCKVKVKSTQSQHWIISMHSLHMATWLLNKLIHGLFRDVTWILTDRIPFMQNICHILTPKFSMGEYTYFVTHQCTLQEKYQILDGPPNYRWKVGKTRNKLIKKEKQKPSNDLCHIWMDLQVVEKDLLRSQGCQQFKPLNQPDGQSLMI